MFTISPLRKRQFTGGVLGLIIGFSIFYILTLESSEQYISIGSMNTGHGDLSCTTCHNDARGNLSQQVQSNIAHAFGQRKDGVNFGTNDVDVNNCLECHDRPNDRHPTHRFEEPRFKEAISKIDAVTCLTCHAEHRGERVTIANIGYCINCHDDLEVKNDPLDISHVQLIKKDNWGSCIQCHDFHGNHRYSTPELLKDTIPMTAIRSYLLGEKDPYGSDKKYFAKDEVEWLKEYGKK